ncbi:hypothetical protein HPB50_012246 [Hyalomma asiaticum]|uniref:Uncharacterized protein n=1 Tax=Hyalomma asiaticum TaxID=266040 RepID=A0ACB7TDK6_HYAAI|nr:hypothetical protein HPB50_012246 [Hyalomma asiaticum]
MDQINNYTKKTATWNETTGRYCIVLRNLSTKAYEYIRSEGLLRLPCRNTLHKYIGTSTGEVGFSPLVRLRLQTEFESLPADQSKVCSLIVDEIHIKQKLEYKKQRDAFIGDVNMSRDLQQLVPGDRSDQLANSLLCFLLCGLASRFKIPVGYFFTKSCTGPDLAAAITYVVKKTEELGFEVVRLVTDNHKTNVSAMELLCKGQPKTSAPHPADPSRHLFLAFDQCHIIKNVRYQFLAKCMGAHKDISSAPLKELYKMQKGSTVKPIRFLTRKHLYPTNIEKMSVKHAVQTFSPPVTAALHYMKSQAGHTYDIEFATVGPTVEFMEVMHRWLVLMDVSNTQQHIHKNNPDTRQFSDPNDSRLEWLEETFLDYLKKLKDESHPDNFLSKETYAALVLTTTSNVMCIRFLLTEKKFIFVLTRKFSSDPIEALFGFLRRTAGCNGAMDMTSVLCGMEKMLKTGIISSSLQSNVNDSASFCAATAVSSVTTGSTNTPDKSFFPVAAINRLREICTRSNQWLPNPEIATLALIGGYLARVMAEKLSCQGCIELVEKPNANAPVDGLIAYQDRGGLKYPTKELITLLISLGKFVDIVLDYRKQIVRQLETSVEHATFNTCHSDAGADSWATFENWLVDVVNVAVGGKSSRKGCIIYPQWHTEDRYMNDSWADADKGY